MVMIQQSTPHRIPNQKNWARLIRNGLQRDNAYAFYGFQHPKRGVRAAPRLLRLCAYPFLTGRQFVVKVLKLIPQHLRAAAGDAD